MKKLAFLCLVLFLILQNGLLAQDQEIDVDAFVEQTQHVSTEDDEMVIAWWVPVEFWEIIFQGDASMTEEQKNEFVDLLRPFTLMAYVDGEMGPMGGVTYVSEENLRSSMTFKGNNGATHEPLDYNSLPPDVQNLLDIFKPILKNMLGPLGENLHFFVFTDEGKKKERVADPANEGTVEMACNGKKYEWETPLNCLIPPKTCPEDNAQLNGAWEYCPFHGDKLIEKTK